MNRKLDSFMALKVLHLSLLAGLSLFAIISFFIAGDEEFLIADESIHRIIQVIIIIVSVSFLILGYRLFTNRIITIRSSTESAPLRMDQYRSGCIIWWAMIEAPGMMSIIGYLLTANHAFLFLSIFHIMVLFLFRPRKENIILLLNLNSEEVMRLEGKI
jgi:hypothetical protein